MSGLFDFDRHVLLYYCDKTINLGLFPPSPVPATLASIYIRLAAVFKSSDCSFSNYW